MSVTDPARTSIPENPRVPRPAPLALVHGFALNAAVWSRLVPVLTPLTDRPLVLPELPGHGHAGTARDGDLETWLANVCEGLPAEVIWVGWSLGGLLGLALRARHPERLAGLVLVGASPRFVAAPGWPGVGEALWAQFGADLRDRYDDALGRFIALQAGAGLGPRTTTALKRVVRAGGRPSPEALTQGLALLTETDLRATLSPAGPPVWVIHGLADRIVPPAAAKAMAGALNAPWRPMAGAGHAPFWSEPRRFAEILTQCLSGDDSPLT